MRNSTNVLNSLCKHSKDLNYKYERLYRILYNKDMYAVAYQRIAPKQGNMTAGTDGKTIDGMSLERIDKLIASLKDESYQPKPSRRTYIPKKNGKMRPLGIPAIEDKLLQEVVRMVLEAIYEEQFSTCSHGFRPQRSCHTALEQITKAFCGTKWYIEGDIKGFFDNINHDVMIKILEKRIKDSRFIRLIRKFLLNSLCKHSKDLNYKYERLYRILYNKDMYAVAYQRIAPKQGNMTAGTDGKTIDGMSLERIDKLIASLKDESYQPKPSRRTYIPKKNGKMRPLGIPAIEDKLLQEVVRMVLEAIYEEQFSTCSHGFRPQRSCHTALEQITKAFCGTKWYIEGDIKGFFDNINHDVMIKILEKRIKDSRFIRLIRKFLNAGYIEDWQYFKSYGGTPQGGIISPILANIYLDQLDKYMEEYIVRFDKGKRKEVNKQYRHYQRKKGRAKNALKKAQTAEERDKALRLVKAYDGLMLKTSSRNDMDENYKRLKYVRYADDFLCGVIGSKEDATNIKADIKIFLETKLKLELSEEKTLITHSETPAKFLGFEIRNRKCSATKRDSLGRKKRSLSKTIEIKIPLDTVKKKLLAYDVVEIKKHNGKEIWKPKARPELNFNDDLEILQRYNSEIRGFYNYFGIAVNCAKQMNNFGHIMEYSMYKTFAAKYRSKVTKVCRKYKKDGIFTISYQNKKGKTIEAKFYNGGFKRLKPSEDSEISTMPNFIIHSSTTSLIDRLKAQNCELCGATDRLEMHHVRKLKGLKGKEPWKQFMIARKRKTIALCSSCHKKVHYGTI
jgi:group II intron reverse transcriptase/maturase